MMSAPLRLTDINRREREVRFLQKKDSCTGGIPTLFDYLVRAHKQQGWKGEADHFRCLEVDYQLYLCGQLYRKISWARAIENPCNVVRSRSVHVAEAWAIRHRPSHFAFFSPYVQRGQMCFEPEVNQPLGICLKQR